MTSLRMALLHLPLCNNFASIVCRVAWYPSLCWTRACLQIYRSLTIVNIMPCLTPGCWSHVQYHREFLTFACNSSVPQCCCCWWFVGVMLHVLCTRYMWWMDLTISVSTALVLGQWSIATLVLSYGNPVIAARIVRKNFVCVLKIASPILISTETLGSCGGNHVTGVMAHYSRGLISALNYNTVGYRYPWYAEVLVTCPTHCTHMSYLYRICTWRHENCMVLSCCVTPVLRLLCSYDCHNYCMLLVCICTAHSCCAGSWYGAAGTLQYGTMSSLNVYANVTLI